MDISQAAEALRHAKTLRDADDVDGAWEGLLPLFALAQREKQAVGPALEALQLDGLPLDARRDEALALLRSWASETAVVGALGRGADALVDLRYLNASPPEHPYFAELVRALEACIARGEGDERLAALRGLTTAARVAGRRYDGVCERAHRAVVAAEPDDWTHHYNLGLFLKTRGRFAEGTAVNQTALGLLGEEEEDGVTWNLGICATGAGRGEVAYQRWLSIGCKMSWTEGELPVGTWPSVQVRLAERPLAERSAEQDDPGDEETIWVQRLSPCHGRVRSALYADLGVDYGDLVLFDGAPIVTRTWGERRVPVFPHLGTLKRGEWRRYAFAGTQPEGGVIDALGRELPGEAELYVHTEQFRTVCAACWEDEQKDHQHASKARRVVFGKLVAPVSVSEADVLASLRALCERDGATVLVPALLRAVGDEDGAEVSQRRVDILWRSARAPS